MSLPDFLLARIAEDEAWARFALDSLPAEHQVQVRLSGYSEGQWAVVPSTISTLDPARIVAECEAKRRIVESARENTEAWERGKAVFLPDDTACVLYLAAVYADHPDYDPEWRP